MSEHDGRHDFDVLHNVDEFSADHWPGFEGISLRVFNPSAKMWSIHWADNAVGRFLPPTVGRFRDGRGDFFGDEVIDGRPINVHVAWVDADTAHPAWSEEFSADGGQTWEVNRRMTLTRLDEVQ